MDGGTSWMGGGATLRWMKGELSGGWRVSS